MPVITVGWSGQCDYLFDDYGKEHFYNVGFDIQAIQKEAVWDGVLQKDSMWSYARKESTKEQMRKCLDDVRAKNTKACEYAQVLLEKFEPSKMYNQFVDSILSVTGNEQQDSKVVVL